MRNRFYSLTEEGKAATLDIFGDISSWADKGSGASVADLTNQLANLGEVETIAVNINSYGGEVAEGLAIYNALRNHKAKVTTRCSGFACSIASVIFMAGEERIMDEASLLMIHNAWTFAEGNAADLRKQAADLDKITEASVKAFQNYIGVTPSGIVGPVVWGEVTSLYQDLYNGNRLGEGQFPGFSIGG